MWAQYIVNIMKVLLCSSNLMTEATLNNNLTSTCVQSILQITNEDIAAVARVLPVQHLTIRYSSKRKRNDVRFTDNKELCFPAETLEIRIQIIWYLDSYYHKNTFPFLGTLIPSKPSTLSLWEDRF